MVGICRVGGCGEDFLGGWVWWGFFGWVSVMGFAG